MILVGSRGSNLYKYRGRTGLDPGLNACKSFLNKQYNKVMVLFPFHQLFFEFLIIFFLIGQQSNT